jgi:hypothetical protein
MAPGLVVERLYRLRGREPGNSLPGGSGALAENTGGLLRYLGAALLNCSAAAAISGGAGDLPGAVGSGRVDGACPGAGQPLQD